jgi:hypothetical protein
MFPDVMVLRLFEADWDGFLSSAVSVLPNELTYVSRVLAASARIFFGADVIGFRMHSYGARRAHLRAYPAALAEKIVYSNHLCFAVREYGRIRALNPALEA